MKSIKYVMRYRKFLNNFSKSILIAFLLITPVIQSNLNAEDNKCEDNTCETCETHSDKNIITNIHDAIISVLEKLILKKNNFYTVDEERKIYRSRQLTPEDLEEVIKTYEIKTVINLRGTHPKYDWWKKEKTVIEKFDIKWVNIFMKGTEYPTVEQLEEFLHAVKNNSNPVLVHCRAGADRTSLGSFLIEFFKDKNNINKPTLKEALKQLSIKYRHFAILLPKMSEFCKKFGECYINVESILSNFYINFDNISDKQIKSVKIMVKDIKFFDHVIAAMNIFKHN